MDDQQLLAFISEHRPRLTDPELRAFLGARRQASVHRRIWPLLERGAVEFDGVESQRLVLVRVAARGPRRPAEVARP